MHFTHYQFRGQWIDTHDAICLHEREWTCVVWRERWYALTSRVSLQDLYMTWENQVFVVDVVVIDLTYEMMFLSVFNRLAGVVVELNTIT